MGDTVDSFAEATPKLTEIRRLAADDVLHRYSGELQDTGTSVRILTLAPDVADDDDAVDAFTRVSDQWFNASANKHIVSVSERGTTPRPWIALPDTNSDTLETVHADLSPEAIETVVADTATALRTLGLYNTVHGHLSPADIWITEAAEGTGTPTARVGGFGLEQAVRAAVGNAEPTPYTAPELLDAPDQPTESTDVYDLGAVAYFALTGRPPVSGADVVQAIRDGPILPPSTYTEDIAPALDDVVRQALSTDPADRQDSPYTFNRAFRSAFSPDQLSQPEPAVRDGSDTTTTHEETSPSSEPVDDAPNDSDARAERQRANDSISKVVSTLFFGGIGVALVLAVLYGSCLGLNMALVGDLPGASCGPSLDSASAEMVDNDSQQILISGSISGASDTNATVSVAIRDGDEEYFRRNSGRELNSAGNFNFTVQPGENESTLSRGDYTATVEYRGTTKNATFTVGDSSEAASGSVDDIAVTNVFDSSESVRISGNTTGLASETVALSVNVSSADDSSSVSEIPTEVASDGTFSLIAPYDANGTEGPYEVTVRYNGEVTTTQFGLGLQSVTVTGVDSGQAKVNFEGTTEGVDVPRNTTLDIRLENDTGTVFENTVPVTIEDDGTFQNVGVDVSDSDSTLPDGEYTLVVTYGDDPSAEDTFSVPFEN